MAEDQTKLRIVLTAVDRATKPIRDVLSRISGPMQSVGARLSGAFRAVGGAVKSLLGKIPLLGAAIGGLVGGAVYGLKKLIDGFDDLGDTADRVGFSADALAQLRYAAKRSGVEVQRLDKGLENFSKILGQAKAGTGSLKSFLDKASPALLKQLKAAKGNEEAFNLLADAMVKLKDPAKRAALAQQAFGDASIATLVGKGSTAIGALRQRYAELAGPQGDAVNAAGEFGDAMDDLEAATDGVKVALVTGFAPALTKVVTKLREWLVGHRAQITQWIKDFADRLPGAIDKVVSGIKSAIDKVTALYDKYKEIRRAVFGPSVDERVEEISKRTLAFQAKTFKNFSYSDLLEEAGKERQKASNLYTKPGGYSEDDEVQIKLAEKHAAALERMAELKLFPKGPSLDMQKFAHRYAMADPTQFEKYDADILQPIFGALARVARAGADRAIDFSGRPVLGDSGDVVRNLAAPPRGTEAKVTVDFANAPRGTRATVNPQSTADVDLSVGYNLLPGTP